MKIVVTGGIAIIISVIIVVIISVYLRHWLRKERYDFPSQPRFSLSCVFHLSLSACATCLGHHRLFLIFLIFVLARFSTCAHTMEQNLSV